MIAAFTHLIAYGLGGLTALAVLTAVRWTGRGARPGETPPQAAERRQSRARALDGYGLGRGGYRALTLDTAAQTRNYGGLRHGETKGGRYDR